MPNINLSDIDTKENLKLSDLDKYELFREYEKDHNKFKPTNNYFVSNDKDGMKYIKICGISDEKYIEKIDKTYIIHYDINYNEMEIIRKTKEIDLLIIKKLNLEINNEIIDIKNLIKNNQLNLDDTNQLIKDLYYNSYYYKKFDANFEDSQKICSKKYLFKIKKGEITMKNHIEQCLNI